MQCQTNKKKHIREKFYTVIVLYFLSYPHTHIMIPISSKSFLNAFFVHDFFQMFI